MFPVTGVAFAVQPLDITDVAVRETDQGTQFQVTGVNLDNGGDIEVSLNGVPLAIEPATRTRTEVGVECEPQTPEHQDFSLRHTETPALWVHRPLPIAGARQHLGEDGEHLPAHLRRDMDVLQPPNSARNVIARTRVAFDAGDVWLVELLLRIDDLAHGDWNDEVD